MRSHPNTKRQKLNTPFAFFRVEFVGYGDQAKSAHEDPLLVVPLGLAMAENANATVASKGSNVLS